MGRNSRFSLRYAILGFVACCAMPLVCLLASLSALKDHRETATGSLVMATIFSLSFVGLAIAIFVLEIHPKLQKLEQPQK